MTGALEVAERALAAAGGREALVRVAGERSLLLRFARSRPTQATRVDDVTVEVAVVRDGHVGRATTNSTEADGLSACARAAGRAAEASARRGGAGPYPGFPAAGTVRPANGHDADTARLDVAVGARALADAFAVCAGAGVEAHGIWTAGEVETAVASSAGVLAAERLTDAFMKVTAIGAGDRSGYATASGVAARELDAIEVASAAASKASAGGPTAELPPGEHPVVLEPPAVAELLELLGPIAFGGLAYAEGLSALSGRLGTRVAAACVNLADSPRHPRTLPHAFDAEGVGKAPLPLIEDGVARGVVHDTASAAVGRARSTGHAFAPGGGAPGPLPLNLVLTGGGARDERELCAGIERGVYVTRLWYTNVVRPKETLITGLTRDGTFLIERGEVTRPLRDMRLGDSVLGVLARCDALTARSLLVSEGSFYGRRFATGVVCPAIRSRMRFTA